MAKIRASKEAYRTQGFIRAQFGQICFASG